MTCDGCSKITRKNYSHEFLGIQRCEDCQRMVQDRFLEIAESREYQEWCLKAERAVDRAYEVNR